MRVSSTQPFKNIFLKLLENDFDFQKRVQTILSVSSLENERPVTQNYLAIQLAIQSKEFDEKLLKMEKSIVETLTKVIDAKN